jgi:hypothetical protein
MEVTVLVEGGVMTDPRRVAPSVRPGRRDLDADLFTEAEKLAIQREAQHAAAASGRRVAGLAVQQYLAHERCTEACSSAGHPGHRAAADPSRRPDTGVARPPSDVRPRISDLWAWLAGGPAGGSGHPGRNRSS